MKKFFTLCAVTAVAATSALAVNAAKANQAPFQISPEAMSRLVAQPAQTVNVDNDEATFYTRSWTDQNGNRWSFQLSKREPCYNLTEEGSNHPLPEREALAELPLWFVECGINCENSSGNTITRAAFGLFWPCYSYWNNSQSADSLDIVSPENLAKGGYVYNPNGTVSQVPTTGRFQKRGNYFLTEDTSTGWFTAYGFMSLRFSESELCTINNRVIPYNQNGGYTDGSSIVFEDVENDVDGIIFTLPINVTANSGGQSGTIACHYVGSIRQTLTPSTYAFNIGNVNVFYMGNQFDNAYDEGHNEAFWGDWGPLAEYYFAISTPQLSILPLQRDENGQSITSGPFDMNKLGNYRTSEEAVPESAFSYIRGVFMTEAANQPMERVAGQFIVTKPEEVTNPNTGITSYRITPAAGMMIPSVPNTAAYASRPNGEYREGLNCVWQRYFFYPVNPSQVNFGTTNGVYISLIDQNGSTYKGTFKGSIMYAKDPANMYDMTEIPAVGTLEPSGVENINVSEDATINAANGMINVIANENATVEVYALNGAKVASVRALAGQLTTINAAKGMYVVKVGNQAKKVVL